VYSGGSSTILLLPSAGSLTPLSSWRITIGEEEAAVDGALLAFVSREDGGLKEEEI